jgi:hypothetical protein
MGKPQALNCRPTYQQYSAGAATRGFITLLDTVADL